MISEKQKNAHTQTFATHSGMVFFSFIGFDSVSTLAGEVRNPGRNLPIGIVGTLAIATTLYCAVSLVMCGMIRFDRIDINAPLAESFRQVFFFFFLYKSIISISTLSRINVD
jgi:amino acid transporter